MFDVQPYTVAVPETVLADLRDRLARTRWPDEVENAGWDYGIPRAYLQELIAYWRDGFDWRAQEPFINGFPNVRTTVDDMGIHFVHARGAGPRPLPLLLTHGWPSSFYETLKLIPLLADPESHGGDPADAFDVVAPSIPGYAFSDRPTQRGFDHRRVAALWVWLMEGLGYDRFGAHAYDVGASITGFIGLRYPERLIGYHTTEPSIPTPYLGPGASPLTDEERAYIDLQTRWRADEGGYGAIQRTRPQTLAYGLADSPAGLAAWILEKWHTWTAPPSGSLDAHFTKDELLANVTIYWATESIGAANRYYFEGAHSGVERQPEDQIRVPMGVALGATQAIERAPRSYVERLFPDIRRWAELGRGGHFLMMEEPRLLAEAIRVFFRGLR